jgi:hypothetical protein
LTLEDDFAFHMGAFDKIIHAVEGAQDGAFTTPGWTDDSSDFVPFNAHINIFHRPKRAVEDVGIPDFDYW